MKMPLRVGIVLALLIATAAAVAMNAPRKMALEVGALAALPSTLAEWESVDLRFDEVVYEELAADDSLLRRYSSPDGESVWLAIIYHQNERYGAHDPLVCYRSQGWGVVDTGTVRLSWPYGDFDGVWTLVERGGAERLALHWWYTTGDLATGDRDSFMSRMAMSGIKSNLTFGAFLRVSTIVREGDLEGAVRVLKEFSEVVLPELPGLFEVEEDSE